ncbi:MAG: Unknown protein [uncultured Sulfurovum sp.]|uniref:DUF302 domain-containing protein n=1 Tax=uncultured Sulfurovum sp. TaxID=269237 RepID=A0A6S6TJ50_9BACT|nr:MAG: Unknown protein [uncultured Sulfurovum sp.]
MSSNIFLKLFLQFLLFTSFSFASVLAELQGTKGLAEADLKAMVGKLDSIGFQATAKNEHLENHYYNTFKEKNLDLLSFYTVTDLESLRELLIQNPDFAAYAPFNLLAYKKFDKEEGGDTTWYGHLATETMLDIIGEKDEALKEKFKVMMAKLDNLVTTEMKPTERKKFTFDKALPKEPLLKMVKKFGEVDDIEEYVEEFIVEHNGLFVKNKFIIAGFLDVKFEYDDLELDFEAYDAFWVSSLCHFEFSNAVFNHGSPHAGLFAPCSVYFYVPKDSGELHVGYAKVDNWLSSTGITNKDKIAYMNEISASVIRILEELGFEHKGEAKKALVPVEKVASTESVLIDFYGTKGQPEAELKSMVDKLGDIGFAASAKNEHLENHYYNKFKEKNVDLLNFYTIFDIKSLRSLLIKNPDFGAYAPFNLLAYKKLAKEEGGDTTWYGHLNVETMLRIIGESDKATQDEFKAMMSKVDTHLKTEMKPTEKKRLTFSSELPKKPLLKMVKNIGEVDDIEEYVEEFIVEHNGLFVKNKFIIAGFLDVKFEYDDLELDFEEYDAYWVSSLCHFEFSNAVFNHGAPHAAAFAPCSVYFYIPKDSGELHVGYASVDNWLATTGITDVDQIAYMKEISASVIRIFKELGFKIEGEESTPVTKEVVAQEAVTKVETTQVKAVVKEEKIKKEESLVSIAIPAVPKVNVSVPTVPKAIKLNVHGQELKSIETSIDRSIKYSKRVPPNYLTSAERYNKGGEGASLSHSDIMVGEVDKGRISTYLRTELMSVEEAKSKLKNAGFKILTVFPLDKKKKLTSIVFTSDELQKMSLKENKGHLATLRLLINEKDKKVSITNPLYLAKAFLQDHFDKEGANKILKSLVDEFKGVKNSIDKLKFQLLPKYQFMDKLPYFGDHLVVARGKNLKDKLVDNKRVVFSLDLANGATLVGVKLNKRTQKFPTKIGSDNAGMLPYPLLIENGEAKILDPKYYLSLMYPRLRMEEFMTIATVPDAIANDCTKVFR